VEEDGEARESGDGENVNGWLVWLRGCGMGMGYWDGRGGGGIMPELLVKGWIANGSKESGRAWVMAAKKRKRVW
jgi:hypothetical protein